MRREDGKQWRRKPSPGQRQHWPWTVVTALNPTLAGTLTFSWTSESPGALSKPTDSCSISLPCKRCLFVCLKTLHEAPRVLLKFISDYQRLLLVGEIPEAEWIDICREDTFPSGQRDFSHPHQLSLPVPRLPGFGGFRDLLVHPSNGCWWTVPYSKVLSNCSEPPASEFKEGVQKQLEERNQSGIVQQQPLKEPIKTARLLIHHTGWRKGLSYRSLASKNQKEN